MENGSAVPPLNDDLDATQIPGYDAITAQQALNDALTESTKPLKPLMEAISSGVPGILKNIAPLNGITKMLGLGSLNNGQKNGSGNMFEGENQIETQFDNQANELNDKMQRLAPLAGLTSIGKSMYDATQTQFNQAMKSRDNFLSAQQNIGIGPPIQSQQFRDAAQNKSAIVQSLGNFLHSINAGNAQEMEGKLGELVKQGNLSSDIKGMSGGSAFLQTMGSGPGWLSKLVGSNALQISNSPIIQGIIKSAYANAGIQVKNVNRLGSQILPGSEIKDSPNYKIAQKFDPTWGQNIDDINTVATDANGNTKSSTMLKDFNTSLGEVKNIEKQTIKQQQNETKLEWETRKAKAESALKSTFNIPEPDKEKKALKNQTDLPTEQ